MPKSDPVRKQILKIADAAETLKGTIADLLTLYDGAVTVDVPNQGLWTQAQFDLLWETMAAEASREAFEGLVILFGCTAQQHGDWVPFSRLLGGSNLSDREQRNAHMFMTATAEKLFGEKKWPIEAKQGARNAESGKAEMVYRMDPLISEWYQTVVAPPSLTEEG